MATTDIVQRVREAIVAALDARPAVVALTGRAAGNVVPWRTRGEAELPRIAYLVVGGPRVGGVGDNRRLVVQFSCFAEDEATANALVEQVEAGFTTLTLNTLPTPLDARVEDLTRRDTGEDEEARADLDITLLVTK